MEEPDRGLVVDLRIALADRADPERAAAQQRYMRSVMPFLGLGLPEVRTLTRATLREHPLPDRETWETTVRTLYDEATYREERYAALAVARAGSRWHDPRSVPLWHHLVVTGEWWDLVDETATHLVGPTLAAHPAEVTPVMWDWASDPDPWLRRTAIICQLGRKDRTDLDLLRHAIEANVDDDSFWLRKAIGWALRQHARTDPDWVRAEVERLGDRLSPLSRREALKHLG